MIIKYLLPIIALSLVIAIHELGHLIIARLFKVKVEVYSIGIGKKFFKYNFKETEFALSLIPLGGYCKLKGGDIQNPILDADSIDSIHPIKRAIIFFAGPFFNLILTFLLLSIILLLPVHQKLPTTILPVLGNNLPAEEGGLLKGDKILSINGTKIESFNDISQNIYSDELKVKINRNNIIKTFIVKPQVIEGRSFIGVYPYIPLKILKDSNDELKKNDILIKINNENIDNYFTLISKIDGDEQFELTYLRDSHEFNISYSLKKLNNIQFTEIYANTLFDSIVYGIKDTFDMLANIYNMFINLFKTGEVTKNISSPLRLVYEVGNSIDGIYRYNSILITVQSFLTIMASISLTLGFINLLPIPVLDGGQILINTISAFKGSAISKSFIYAYQTAGLIIVLLLFTIGISNDIFFFGDL